MAAPLSSSLHTLDTTTSVCYVSASFWPADPRSDVTPGDSHPDHGRYNWTQRCQLAARLGLWMGLATEMSLKVTQSLPQHQCLGLGVTDVRRPEKDGTAETDPFAIGCRSARAKTLFIPE